MNIAFIAMTLWLLNIANSATSRVCLALGCLVIAAAHSKAFTAPPRLSSRCMIPAGFCLYLILAFGFGIECAVAGAVGRDPTLTDRTKIWGISSHHAHQSAPWHRLRELLAGPRLVMVLARLVSVD